MGDPLYTVSGHASSNWSEVPSTGGHLVTRDCLLGSHLVTRDCLLDDILVMRYCLLDGHLVMRYRLQDGYLDVSSPA